MGRSEVPARPRWFLPRDRMPVYGFSSHYSRTLLDGSGFPFFSVVGVGFVYRGLIAYSLVFDGLVWATEQKLRLFVFLTA